MTPILAEQTTRRRGHHNATVLLRLHNFPASLGAMHAAHQMHIGDQAEIFHRTFGKTFVSQDARIVHENVNATPAIHGLRHHVLYLRQICNVGAMRHCLTAEAFNFSNHCKRGLRIGTLTRDGTTQIVDHHSGASLGQLNSVAASEAATGAGDQRYLSVITDRHCSLSELFNQ
jgi:hypothetical protein